MTIVILKIAEERSNYCRLIICDIERQRELSIGEEILLSQIIGQTTYL
jgi:hypothetical protein